MMRSNIPNAVSIPDSGSEASPFKPFYDLAASEGKTVYSRHWWDGSGKLHVEEISPDEYMRAL